MSIFAAKLNIISIQSQQLAKKSNIFEYETFLRIIFQNSRQDGNHVAVGFEAVVEGNDGTVAGVSDDILIDVFRREGMIPVVGDDSPSYSLKFGV